MITLFERESLAAKLRFGASDNSGRRPVLEGGYKVVAGYQVSAQACRAVYSRVWASILLIRILRSS